MDEDDACLYRWYVVGCRKLGWMPLNELEFSSEYLRYRRCSRAIQLFEQRRQLRMANVAGSTYHEDVFFERLIRGIRRERERLDFLSTAVSAGRPSNEEPGGAGMPACRIVDPPVLVVAGAKLLPHLDPEPPVRNS